MTDPAPRPETPSPPAVPSPEAKLPPEAKLQADAKPPAGRWTLLSVLPALAAWGAWNLFLLVQALHG